MNSHWRSLEHLADTPEFRAAAREEFPGFANVYEGLGEAELTDGEAGLDRRTFLAAATAAGLAGLAGCRRPELQILPFSAVPDEQAGQIVLGKPTTLGVASGVVAGLVAITPASGYVGPMSAMVIGLVAGVLCFFAVRMKKHFGYDDALDVVGVHAVGGIWGALATGLFASIAVNAAGADGLFFGNPAQFLIQVVAVAASISFAFVGSFVLLGITDALVGLRVGDEAERIGLDLSEHEENAYDLGA